jgi:hypothetical protein
MARRIDGRHSFDLDDLETVALTLGVSVFDLMPDRDRQRQSATFQSLTDLPSQTGPQQRTIAPSRDVRSRRLIMPVSMAVAA